MDADLRSRIAMAARRLMDYGATAVYLFGSAATGSMREDSDVDMAVAGLPPASFFRAMSDASRIVGRPVDLLALDRGDDIAESLASSGELEPVS
jgi:predicted nucleotidyltransferase